MSNTIIAYYDQYKEDERLIKDNFHKTEFLTTLKAFEEFLPPGCRVFDGCAGTGRYAFWLADRGYRVTAADLNPGHIQTIQSRRAEHRPLEDVFEANVLNLRQIPDNSFDAVLCMGALYHLPRFEDRHRAVSECLRILKPRGILMLTYINRAAVFLHGLKAGLGEIDELYQQYTAPKEDVFYRHTFGEMKKLTSMFGLRKLANIGVDGIGYLIKEKVNALTEEEYQVWLQYHFDTCQEKSTLGYSLHGLWVGEKSMDSGHWTVDS